jgi:hypothetical protein
MKTSSDICFNANECLQSTTSIIVFSNTADLENMYEYHIRPFKNMFGIDVVGKNRAQITDYRLCQRYSWLSD